MDFDDILKEYLGEFGLFQILFFVFICSANMHTPIFEYSFIGASPDHTCHVASLNSFNYSREEIARFVSPPLNGAFSSGGYDACMKYVRDYANVSSDDVKAFLEARNQSEAVLPTTKCTEWEYDNETFKSTFVTEWDLVCGREWLIAISQSAYMAGQFLVFIGGIFSDRFGRRMCVLVFMLIRLFGRVLTFFAPNMYILIVGRFIQGACGNIFYAGFYILGLELVGLRWRASAGVIPNYWWMIGCQLTVGLAYLFRDWRTLIAAGIVCSIPHLALICFLPESPRWLAARGRMRDARHVMKMIARINDRNLPDDVAVTSKTNDEKDKGSLSDAKELFRSWHFMKITLIFILQWNVATLVYYGLIFYLPSIGGNPYISLMLGGLIEFPAAAYTQLTMNTWLGRRYNLSLCFLFSGVVLLAALFIPKGSSSILLTLTVLGKFGVSANWNIIYMITSEVYPTRLRSVGLMFCSMSARVGGALSPFVAQLGLIHHLLPALAMGTLAIVGGLLALLLPETRGKHLQDNIKQDESKRSCSVMELRKRSVEDEVH